MSQLLADKSLPRVTIAADDARKLRDKALAMKRAALNIKLNAGMFVNETDGLIALLDLIIEPVET